jgi:hypothetical protein
MSEFIEIPEFSGPHSIKNWELQGKEIDLTKNEKNLYTFASSNNLFKKTLFL